MMGEDRQLERRKLAETLEHRLLDLGMVLLVKYLLRKNVKLSSNP